MCNTAEAAQNRAEIAAEIAADMASAVTHPERCNPMKTFNNRHLQSGDPVPVDLLFWSDPAVPTYRQRAYRQRAEINAALCLFADEDEQMLNEAGRVARGLLSGRGQ